MPARQTLDPQAVHVDVHSGIVVIGDEILSGHTQDANTHWLASRLDAVGAPLREVRVVPDEVTAITGAVYELQERRGCRLVVTSGGLGPTHDDITVAAVARMHGAGLVLDAAVWRGLSERAERAHAAGKRDTPVPDLPTRKMAFVPEGAEVFPNQVGAAPALLLERTRGPAETSTWTIVLPGVPSEFRHLWETHLEGRVRAIVGSAGRHVHRREVEVHGYESRIAERLTAIAAAHPEVSIGSYPHPGGRIVLRVSGTDRAGVEAATAALHHALGPDAGR